MSPAWWESAAEREADPGVIRVPEQGRPMTLTERWAAELAEFDRQLEEGTPGAS